MNRFLFLWCIIGLKSYPDRKGTLNKAGMVVCMKHQNSILLFISTPIDVSSKQLSIKSEGKNLLSINCLHMDHPIFPRHMEVTMVTTTSWKSEVRLYQWCSLCSFSMGHSRIIRVKSTSDVQGKEIHQFTDLKYLLYLFESKLIIFAKQCTWK